ncbi:MAG: transporter substrate-binding domain-containing protein [Bacteriovoracaceae bacterium]|nr:transporter substrate-binding domain-containing protein [Bacteriovoracaceae bacterium]
MGMAPYINEDNRSGIEYELVAAAFAAVGIEIEHVHNVHFKRAILLIKNNKVDAIASNGGNQLYFNSGLDIYASDKTINYVDCISTLKSRKLKIKSIKDLEGKRVMAFKTASEVLGPDFKKFADNNSKYTESVKQGLQPKLLLRERIEAGISDRNIFHTHQLRMFGEDKSHHFVFHRLTGPTPRNVKFRDQSLMLKFNQGLASIKGNGTYAQIRRKYAKSYKESCSE